MMKNEICSLMEELLPLYAEKIVEKENEKAIENHLKTCEKCRRKLSEIKEENKLFSKEELGREIDNNGEIRCIKGIKRKIKSKIIIAVLVTIVLTIVFTYAFDTYRIMKDADGRYTLYNINTGNIKTGMNATNVFAEYTINDNGKNILYKNIFTFNGDDICINERTMISGYSKNELVNFQKSWENSNLFSNLEIKDDKIYINDNTYIGKEKSKIITSLREKNSTIYEM